MGKQPEPEEEPKIPEPAKTPTEDEQLQIDINLGTLEVNISPRQTRIILLRNHSNGSNLDNNRTSSIFVCNFFFIC